MNEKGSVKKLMEEFGFSIDDVRWYLSTITAERLLTYQEQPNELARLVWSGRLESDLYHMEERYLNDIQQDLERSFKDEAHVRQIFHDIERRKRLRPR